MIAGEVTWAVSHYRRLDTHQLVPGCRTARNGDLGYPATVELSDGSLFSVYYRKAVPVAHCSVLKLDALDLPKEAFCELKGTHS